MKNKIKNHTAILLFLAYLIINIVSILFYGHSQNKQFKLLIGYSLFLVDIFLWVISIIRNKPKTFWGKFWGKYYGAFFNFFYFCGVPAIMISLLD